VENLGADDVEFFDVQGIPVSAVDAIKEVHGDVASGE